MFAVRPLLACFVASSSAAFAVAQPVPLVVGDRVEITAEDLEVKSERTVLGTVDVAERYEVLGLAEGWVRIAMRDGTEGWVPTTNVERVPAIETGDLVEVTAESTKAMDGDEVVATLGKGDELIVLESRDEWLRIRIKGEAGWVRMADVRAPERSFPKLAAEYKERNAAWSRADEAGDTATAIDLTKRLVNLLRRQVVELESRPDVKAAQVDQFRTALSAEATWLPYRLVGDHDEPAQIVRLFRLELRLRKQLDGTDHWRTTDARWGLRTAIRRAELTEEQRGYLNLARLWSYRVVDLHEPAALREAIAQGRRLAELQGKLLGKEHPVRALTLSNLGASYHELGDRAEAKPLYEEVIEIRRKQLGRKHPEYASSLGYLASLLHAERELEAAQPLYEETLEIRREVLGEEHEDSIESTWDLALLRHDRRDLDAAQPLYEKVVELRRKVQGREHPGYALTLNNLGRLLHDRGDHASAKPRYEEALAVRREVLGREHPDYAMSLNNLASLLQDDGDYAAAEPLLAEALDIHQRVLGKEHDDYSLILNNLASLHHARGDLAEARRLYEEALAIRREKLGEDDPDYAMTLSNFANLLDDEGDYAAARARYERVLDIRRRVLGEKHPDYALALNNLAELLKSQGDLTTARRMQEEALAIHREVLGEEHPGYAATLNNLASLLDDMDEVEAAQRMYEEVLAVRRKVLGEGHPDYAISLNNLASLLHRRGDRDAALKMYEEALEIRRRVLGTGHPRYAMSANNLAMLLRNAGDLDGAETLLEEARDTYRRSLGESHPEYAMASSNLASVLHRKGEFAAARERIDEARRAIRKHVARALPGMSSSEQLLFLDVTDAPRLHFALSLGLRHRDDDEAVRDSAGWLLNGKGLATESLAQSLLLARESDDPRAGPLAEELGNVRAQLARASLSRVPDDGADARREELDGLQRRADEIVRELGTLGLELTTNEPWVERADVQKALPEGSVLVDIARFEVFDYDRRRWEEPHYAAWITSRTGSVRLVDLGDAEGIETKLAAARRVVEQGPKVVKEKGEKEAETDTVEALRELAETILHPVLAELGDVDRLIVSPDGALWLAPWAALPLPDGRYAVERFEIGYVVSGRDLVSPQNGGDGSGIGATILADPDFDRTPDRTRPESPDGLRSVEKSFGGIPRATPLPATAAEARAIVPGVRTLVGSDPKLHLGAEATETAFKSLVRPRVVTVATHGFFLKDQTVETKEDELLAEKTRGAATTTDGEPLENSLLRCGVLLAGANQRTNAADDTDDGVLTGVEIVGTDLRGTELVVLSACETGVGEVRNGEGVAGLRQAFQLAGAESVVASLWKVDDLATARLMRDFFENLAEPGTRRTAALRKAQLARIASRRDRYGAAHPFYWAAFTLTGDTGER